MFIGLVALFLFFKLFFPFFSFCECVCVCFFVWFCLLRFAFTICTRVLSVLFCFSFLWVFVVVFFYFCFFVCFIFFLFMSVCMSLCEIFSVSFAFTFWFEILSVRFLAFGFFSSKPCGWWSLGAPAWASKVGELNPGYWTTRDHPAPRNINQRELSWSSLSQH